MRTYNLLGVFALSVVSGCAILESNAGPRVRVTADSAPAELALGDTVHLTITVRNVGTVCDFGRASGLEGGLWWS
jgi:hypothetical protein